MRRMHSPPPLLFSYTTIFSLFALRSRWHIMLFSRLVISRPPAGFDSMKTEYNMLLRLADRKIACALLFPEQKVYLQASGA